MTDDNPFLKSLPLTEAAVAAHAEVADSIIRRLERDRAELIATVRALVALDDGDRPGLWPFEADFNSARALLARLEKEPR